MLLDFAVRNYRSIHERQTLSMVASSYFKEMEATNTFAESVGENMPQLLRSVVLYGPNASGKSTLVQALKFMQDQVLNSQKESQAGDDIDVVPFKLSAAARASDSEFSIAFIEQGVRYDYGFRCNRQRFVEEWLFAYPLGRAQKWFHREFDAALDKDVYKFSKLFEGDRKKLDWTAQTRPNSLFLSTAIQLNNAQLKPAFDWFKQRLRVVSSATEIAPMQTMMRCTDAADRAKVVAFMNGAGMSITDVAVRKAAFSADAFPKWLPAQARADISKSLSGKEVMTLKYVHNDVATGEIIEFDESEESDGTRALFAFAGPWLDVIKNDRVLVVDELDTSLHPLLVQHLVALLHHEKTQAQLVFTTHDTSLLSSKMLRRDQVWFMEKNASRATQLYPLSDFSPRDNEAVERGYLNGRYGGIPFLKDLDFYGL